jgi:hypothetical protein
MAYESAGVGGVTTGFTSGPDGQFSDDQGMTSGMFPGHAEKNSTQWETLKGMMMQPYEFDGIESTSETGASRAHSPSPAISPNSTIEVNTPLTMGGGSMAK